MRILVFDWRQEIVVHTSELALCAAQIEPRGVRAPPRTRREETTKVPRKTKAASTDDGGSIVNSRNSTYVLVCSVAQLLCDLGTVSRFAEVDGPFATAESRES